MYNNEQNKGQVKLTGSIGTTDLGFYVDQHQNQHKKLNGNMGRIVRKGRALWLQLAICIDIGEVGPVGLFHTAFGKTEIIRTAFTAFIKMESADSLWCSQ